MVSWASSFGELGGMGTDGSQAEFHHLLHGTNLFILGYLCTFFVGWSFSWFEFGFGFGLSPSSMGTWEGYRNGMDGVGDEGASTSYWF